MKPLPFYSRWAATALVWSTVIAAPAIQIQHISGTFTVPAASNLPPDAVIIAENMEIAGTAENDVFLLAGGTDPKDSGTINLNGSFMNDVWAWGHRINMKGAIHDHARLGGFSIDLQGQVRGNALLAAGNIRLAPEATLAGNAKLIGENVICEGAVTGNLTIIGNKVTLAGHCGGDVTVKAQDLVILPSTTINGNLDCWTPHTVILPAETIVKGEFRQHKPLPDKPSKRKKLASIPMAIYGYFSALCAGILFVLCCPATAAGAGLAARHTPGRSILVGMIWMTGSFPVIFLLLISIIGAPSAILLAAFTGILIYLGKIIMAMALGFLLIRPPTIISRSIMIGRMALGLAIIQIAVSPVSAAIIWILSAFFGAGALLLAIFGRTQLVSAPAPSAETHPPTA